MNTIEVVNDPGHGGSDRHNVGPTTYIEADGVLDIANQCTKELLTYQDVEVEQTRSSDVSMLLTPRGLMATGKDVFISHHTDASANLSVRGTTVFYSVDLPEDKILAEQLAAAISSRLGIPNRGAKLRVDSSGTEDYYTVIDTAQDAGCKHVFLIEYAFHSNAEDEQLLLSAEIRKDLGQLVATMVAKFYGLQKIDKPLTAYEVEKLEATDWVQQMGISDGSRPKDNVTREESWVMLKRMYDSMTEEGGNI